MSGPPGNVRLYMGRRGGDGGAVVEVLDSRPFRGRPGPEVTFLPPRYDLLPDRTADRFDWGPSGEGTAVRARGRRLAVALMADVLRGPALDHALSRFPEDDPVYGPAMDDACRVAVTVADAQALELFELFERTVVRNLGPTWSLLEEDLFAWTGLVRPGAAQR